MSPQVFIAPLRKSILQVKGRDASKFLNGLVTSRLLPNVIKKKQHTISESESLHSYLVDTINPQQNWGIMHEDIYDPEKTIYVRRDGINSMFINSKGRVETDCFLFPAPFHSIDAENPLIDTTPEFNVEVGPRSSSLLAMQLNLHRLSAKVKVTSRTDLHSYYIYLDTFEFDRWLQDLQAKYFCTRDPENAVEFSRKLIDQEKIFSRCFAENLVGFAVDNRIENFGIKILTCGVLQMEDTSSIFSEKFLQLFAVKPATQEEVDRRRFINGLFEYEDAPKGVSLLPFEMNLDYTNGLSLEKGCYVGQELTIRTFTNGVIRKRIIPIQFFIPEREEIFFDEQHRPEWVPADPVVDYLKDISGQSLTKIQVKDMNDNVTDAIKENAASPFGTTQEIRRRKTSCGKIMAVKDNVGLMLTNLDSIEKSRTFQIQVPSLNGVKLIGLRVFPPDWWPLDE